jgi:hypothetical protein
MPVWLSCKSAAALQSVPQSLVFAALGLHAGAETPQDAAPGQVRIVAARQRHANWMPRLPQLGAPIRTSSQVSGVIPIASQRSLRYMPGLLM